MTNTKETPQTKEQEDLYTKFAGWKEKERHGFGRFFGATKKRVKVGDVEGYLACMMDREPAGGHFHRAVVKYAFFETAKEATDCAYGWYLSAVGGKKTGASYPVRKIEYAVIPAAILKDQCNIPVTVPESVVAIDTVPDTTTAVQANGKRSPYAVLRQIARRCWGRIASALPTFFSLSSRAKPEAQAQ